MVAHIKSSLECIQIAWGHSLRDFRQWCRGDGQAVHSWKAAPLKQSILACRSNMIDDAEAMLKSYQNHINSASEKGQSAFIPVMTTAIAADSPPDNDQVVGRSDWLPCIIEKDPLQRIVKMRTIPSAFRCQIAFFCPDKHGAMMVANEFCLYWKNESKRTFDVAFEVGYAGENKITDNWEFRVFDNNLSPTIVLEDFKNLTVVTVDCTICGLIPVVTGLGGEWDNSTDTGEVGVPTGVDPIKGGIDPAIDWADDLVVNEADVYDTGIHRHTKITGDVKTGVISQAEIEWVS